MKTYLVIVMLVSLFCLPGLASANLYMIDMTSATIVSNVCDEDAVIDVEWVKTGGCQWVYSDLERKLGSGSWGTIASDVERYDADNCSWDDFYECVGCDYEYWEYTDTVPRDYGYIHYKVDAADPISVFLGCDAPMEP